MSRSGAPVSSACDSIQAASASPIGVDGSPSTNGHSSNAIRRQLRLARNRPSTACRPRLIRCVTTNAGGTLDDFATCAYGLDTSNMRRTVSDAYSGVNAISRSSSTNS